MCDFAGLNVKDLKALLETSGIDYRGCVEKSELIALAKQHGLDGCPSSSTSSLPLNSQPTSPQQQLDNNLHTVQEKKNWGVREIKELLAHAHIDYRGCLEKQEFIQLAIKEGLIDAHSLQPTTKATEPGTSGGGFSMKVPKSQAKTVVDDAQPPGPASQPLDQLTMQFFAGQVKNVLLPLISKQFKEAKLDPIQDQFEGKGIGAVQFGTGVIEIAKVDIPSDQVSTDIKEGRIQIESRCIQLALMFDWFYKKLSFPKISSSGSAQCSIEDTSIALIIQWGAPSSSLQKKSVISVPTCTVNIGQLEIDIEGTKAKLIYQLLLKALKCTIKAHLEKVLADMIVHAIQEQANQMFSQ